MDSKRFSIGPNMDGDDVGSKITGCPESAGFNLNNCRKWSDLLGIEGGSC